MPPDVTCQGSRAEAHGESDQMSLTRDRRQESSHRGGG
jgi:hypothetical protein